MSDAVMPREPFMPTVTLSPDAAVTIAGGEVVTWKECLRRLAASTPVGSWQEAGLDEALALPPCPFCGSELSVAAEDIDCFIGHVECSGCDMRGPISEWKYEDPEEAKADAVARWNAAWNRRPAPMEAVAWREKALADVIALRKDHPGQTDRFYAEEAVAICRRALAVIPTQGGEG